MLVVQASVVSMGMVVALYIKCMNFFYRRETPDTSDNLALIGVAGFFQRGSFSGLWNLAPKNTFHELLRNQLS